jgi:hypothetical protein
MLYAFVQDIPASWEHYERLAAAIGDPVPAGLILHVAGPTDEGFRTIEVWETRDAWERFERERGVTVITRASLLTTVTLRELHALNKVP